MPAAAQVNAAETGKVSRNLPNNGQLARKPRTFSPSEFVAELEEHGLIRSERWAQDHCKSGDIKTLPLAGRWIIPESELFRIIGVEDWA